MASQRLYNWLRKRAHTWDDTQTHAKPLKLSASTSGIGSVPSAVSAYVTAAEYGSGDTHKTILTIDALPISTTDNGTAGHGGGSQVYDFPQGYLIIAGSSMAWDTITSDGTGLPNDSALELGLGTTAATSAMASLTGTTEDLIAGDGFTLSSSLSAVNRYKATVSAGNIIDGSVTAKDAYLNVACSVATADADGTLTVSGEVTVIWQSLGVKPS